jgi:hypothetical protein
MLPVCTHYCVCVCVCVCGLVNLGVIATMPLGEFPPAVLPFLGGNGGRRILLRSKRLQVVVSVRRAGHDCSKCEL